MKNLSKKGFTLIELLVVISIIGLLSTIAVVSLGSARAKSRDTKRAADIKQMQTALEQYYSDQGNYPADHAATGDALGAASGQANACGTGHTCNYLSSTNGLLDTFAGTTYMTLPTDPTPPAAAACSGSYASPGFVANYCYFSATASAASTAYIISWKLENSNASLGAGTSCTSSNSGTSCV